MDAASFIKTLFYKNIGSQREELLFNQKVITTLFLYKNQ